MGYEKRDLEPVLLKFAVPLALSIGGIVYSLLMNKRSKASRSRHDPRTRSDYNNHMNSRSNIHQASQTATSSLHFDPLLTDKREVHHSLNPVPDMEPPKVRIERDSNEQEIKNLRNSVRILKERERNLEIELLQYYGQKEQETAVMELQNRLKLNNMEAKLYALKIESLQADNKRLQVQMSDYTKAVTDLEAARAKIKLLKKKHKSETQENKKLILDFQQRVQKMQDNEHKNMVKVDLDIELNSDKLKSLETEVEDLRKSNDSLQLEKAELERRLDCVQMLATSILEDSETEKLKEESENLKKQNEDLSQQLERIQADKCADVEEIVYLKWINACLRHELRNYKPGSDETSARDLSKSLSPRSEEKAKQMILEYAGKEGGGERNINLPEIDSDRWTSRSQGSSIADSGEIDESFIDDSLPRKNNNYKFFGKLIRMLRRKDSHSHHHHHHSHRHSRSSSRSEDMYSPKLSENPKSRTSNLLMDSRRLTRRHSDVCVYKQIDSIAEDDDGEDGGGRLSASSLYGKRSELEKYAEVFKDTYATANRSLHKSSLSLGFI
ncbi:hypothetical protein L1887_10931 [Cichorium endivia]|nr:hypothetical protein L1887_10931 [Cichorium endivia]